MTLCLAFAALNCVALPMTRGMPSFRSLPCLLQFSRHCLSCIPREKKRQLHAAARLFALKAIDGQEHSVPLQESAQPLIIDHAGPRVPGCLQLLMGRHWHSGVQDIRNDPPLGQAGESVCKHACTWVSQLSEQCRGCKSPSTRLV